MPIPPALRTKDTTLMGSGTIFQSMNSHSDNDLSTIFKLRGINITISAACASGSHSIGMGLLMRQGLQDMIICGGTGDQYLSMGSFDGISAFSVRKRPTKASGPFDHAIGLVPSGGRQLSFSKNDDTP